MMTWNCILKIIINFLLFMSTQDCKYAFFSIVCRLSLSKYMYLCFFPPYLTSPPLPSPLPSPLSPLPSPLRPPLSTSSHESHVKHVVIESSTDPVSGVLYHITPNGPRFNSLYDLIEQAQKKAVIQNHSFEIVLGKCPPKVPIHVAIAYLFYNDKQIKFNKFDGDYM